MGFWSMSFIQLAWVLIKGEEELFGGKLVKEGYKGDYVGGKREERGERMSGGNNVLDRI